MNDISDMSEEFHDWLEQCPCHWFKKYGESTYTFSEENSDDWKDYDNRGKMSVDNPIGELDDE